MARTINLTDRDLDYISRVVDTEVPRSILRTSPSTYNAMVRAVVDTVTNRLASGGYPNTVTGVLNQRRQFSKITGPSNQDPYGSVQNTPKASKATQDLVRQHIENRVAGAESTIGGSVNYANPNVSDRSNLRSWINPMIEAGARRLGIGRSVHYHGNAPGAKPAGEYGIALNGVDNTGALSRIPTPTFADRAGTGLNQADSAVGIMAAIDPATPQTVERGLLAAPDYGLNAVAEAGVTPGASAGGQVSGLLSYQATPDQMADMQERANVGRRQLEAANTGLSLTPDQIEAAMGRRQAALGLLTQQQQPITNAAEAIQAVSPTQATPRNNLAEAYNQLGTSLAEAGTLDLSGMKQRDPADVLEVGRLQPNPLVTKPESIETASIDGPATSEIDTPDTTPAQETAEARPRVNPTIRNVGASVAGGLAGSMLGGPLGGILGAALGREIMGAPGQSQRAEGLLSRLTGQGRGLLSDPWSGIGNLNSLGSGAQASYGAWGGQRGDTALASDGSRITNLGGGLVSRIDRNGVETRFRDGEPVGGSGGRSLFSGLFSGGSGSGTSQADRATTSTGLY